MKLTLAKHGGLAAGLRLPPIIVDAAGLPGAAAGELSRLVAAAIAAPAVDEAVPGRARDQMSYTLTVEADGHPTILKQSDTTMSPAFAALLDWLQKRAG